MTPRREPAIPAARAFAGMSGVSTAAWDVLAPPGIDHAHAYLTFREQVEPGDPVLVVAGDATGPAAAAHGSWTTPRTALFSHPWKMLASPQFARLAGPVRPGGTGEPDSAETEHRQLLHALTPPGPPARSDGPATVAALTSALGEVVVAREFDTSSVLLRPGLGAAARSAALAAVLLGLQDVARSRGGAVALPYVRPDDAELRQALAAAGFRGGALTAVSVFDLAGSYEDFVAGLHRRQRRRYRAEPAAFAAAGLRTGTVELTGSLDRLIELEAANAERYGGTPDRARLTGVRTQMARLLGSALRVPVAERDGEIVACCIDLTDSLSYLGLVYGCDYSVPEHRLAYRQLAFYEPLSWAADHGLAQIRLGFEAFAPKLYRGARLEPRQTWLWAPGQSAMAGLGALLDFLSARTAAYLAALGR
ncbi:MAG TPA: GNAT family N-acetyltransferase [Streptosporangiaceae bacterium]|jgi:hypothetical protein